ncbi:N-acetyllactosaminide beta-1,3-N-acetylglucosaminyltransferase 3 [Phascolarctos cinereus]|uniref:Hexosyltransferase n=1 Tax=Phascolarctos cinereus TaxID=38626 RepID=A0A6P5M1V7_PHACI|nr:N-acetyllactosaminide beta-1,3-N-acetylglucosaminyltransferase 3 [Phascolarctos cinereus]XP_020864726.1 N-acetyllactosaminide beta-1,3-N-acetylglucosaminyltransferase 3 [Phascolarctos cinereus]XP_020864727.1 N-acetyllactosaminide beta-1,3-N-acetylglucosaminyltransferase 3 [Phascolarctos cinereus]XP_020864728.1 N-acetyllactosaminide beta-1,3-N-acetylglucosaminyltransferase 3 [Phascolarctos cinereus]XP_020864729.1 N-acetyllactosaminide beta-1,3-N-acetylglucosaminyltransferase 3 [Phascolarctos 
MLRLKKRRTQALILLALAAGVLIFLIQDHFSELSYKTRWQDLGMSEPKHQIVLEPQQQQRVPEPQTSALPQRLLVPCFANASVANVSGFSAQPRHIQDFLLYKHCRHFPILQSAPANKCTGFPGGVGPVFLLLAIKSSPKNYERRDLIRRTWGQEREVNGATIRRLFLVGTEPRFLEAQKVNWLLAMEAQAHGDILQWDFHDTFFNLTLKQVLFLEWQAVQCPDVSFIFNGDDDIFAHTDNMVVYLQGNRADKHLFVGYVISNVGPIRVPQSKYFVPELVMKENKYPPYCGGGGILMSKFTTGAIRHASHVIPLFPIDDVYLGMCLEREGLAPARHMGVRVTGIQSPSPRIGSFNPCFYQDLLLVHRFLPYEMLLMWDAIKNPDLECSKSILYTPSN